MHRLTIAATIVLLSVPVVTLADTITLMPTGAGSIADWSSSDCPGADWDCLNDNASNPGSGTPATNDGDTTNLQDNDGSTGRVMVALDDGLISAGATVDSIAVHAWMKKSGGGTRIVRLSYQRMGTDGSPVDGATDHAPGGAYTDFTETWSSLGWTPDDIDDLQIGVVHIDGTILFTQLYVIVTYTPVGGGSAAVNYRSIGTQNTPVYDTGDASITTSDTVVTFSNGASLPDNIGQGDELVVGGETFWILSRDSATQMTVQTAATGNRSGAYTIDRAFNTIASWESTQQGDLVAENRREVGVCYNDGPIPVGGGATWISGSTTDAEHYMTLTAAVVHRHNGTAGTGVVLDGGGSSADDLIEIHDDYTVIEWLEITDWQGAGNDAIQNMDGANSTLQNLIIHYYGNDAVTRPAYANAYTAIYTQRDTTIRNCMIYDGSPSGIWVQDATLVLENVTIFDIRWDGFQATSTATVDIRNVICVGGGEDSFEINGATIDYFGNNMYETGSCNLFDPDAQNGGNAAPPGDLDDLFVSITASSEDLHLEPDAPNAIDAGEDLSANFTTDIDGDTRTAPWDMGADEAGAAVNYRSIGTQATPIYSTGDASITTSDTVVTFSNGASLPTNVGQGDELVVGGETFYILSRDSATQMTVQTAATGNRSGSYTIDRAYNDPQTWESASGGDLVAANRREVGVCYNDSTGPFTTAVNISTNTTDATHYMTLTVAVGQRHDGTPGSGARFDGVAEDVIDIDSPYTVIEWLEFTNFSGGSVEAISVSDATNTVFRNLLIHDFDGATNGMFIEGVGASMTVRNTIIFNGADGVRVLDGTDATLENVTIYDMSSDGVDTWPGSALTMRNCIVVGNVNDLELDGTVDYFGNNLYESYTGNDPEAAAGANNQTNPPADLDDLFVSIAASSEDLHLEPNAPNAIDAGEDLSADFTTDIDGNTRSAPWDIGADEAGAAAVNYYYVRKTGSDSANGLTPATAWLTIDKAANTMTAGDWVYVGAGTYDEAVTPSNDGTALGPIRFIADTDGSKTGDAGMVNITQPTSELYVVKMDTDDYIEFDGFTITGGTDAMLWVNCTGGIMTNCEIVDAGGSAIEIDNASVTVQGCEIRNTADRGVNVKDASTLTMTDCSIHDSTNEGVFIAGSGVPDVTISRSRIYANGREGIDQHLGDLTVVNCLIYGNTEEGILAKSGSNTTAIWHCTIDNNGTSGIQQESGTATIRNCVITNHSGNGLDLDGGTMDHTYNLIWGNGTNYAGTSAGTGEVTSDPFFTGATDYHLQTGSPGIDAGTDASSQTIVDLESTTRPQVGGWDMGCYESTGIDVIYRSVGTDTLVLYDVDVASISASSRTVTFGSASLPTNIGRGDKLTFTVSGDFYHILSRDSTTQVTVQETAGTTRTDKFYKIERAYSDFSVWETAREGNLVADNRREVAVAYDDGDFNPASTIIISGSTTDFTHYMQITVAEGHRHDGTEGTGVLLTGLVGDVIEISDEYTVVEWLEITGFGGTNQDGVTVTDSPSGANSLLQNLIIHDYADKTAMLIEDVVTIRNCIFYDGYKGIYVYGGIGNATIENCTFWNMSRIAIDVSVGSGPNRVTIRNTIAVGCIEADIEGGIIDYFGNNMYETYAGTDPEAAPGSNNTTNVPSPLTGLFLSVTDPGIDLHLQSSGHDALGGGLDLSADFQTDIDDQTRTIPWEMGADEVVVSTAKPTIIRWAEVEPN